MATISVRQNISINADPEEVFFYLVNLDCHFLWDPSLRELSKKGRLKLGDTYRAESCILGGITTPCLNKVTVFEENKSLGLQNRLGLVKYDIVYSLTSHAESTLVSSNVDILTKSRAFGLTFPVLKQLATSVIQTDLTYLKLAVENKLAASLKK